MESSFSPENLPSREQNAFDVYKLAPNCSTIKMKLEVYRLYAEIMGFIEVRHSEPDEK